MKFVFYAKMMKGCLCVISIRKNDQMEWYHFRRSNWSIKSHIQIVQKTIESYQFSNYRQIPINITRAINVLEYYDAINDRFFFKGYPLEKGKLKS